MRRNKLEHIVTTGMIEGKRSSLSPSLISLKISLNFIRYRHQVLKYRHNVMLNDPQQSNQRVQDMERKRPSLMNQLSQVLDTSEAESLTPDGNVGIGPKSPSLGNL